MTFWQSWLTVTSPLSLAQCDLLGVPVEARQYAPWMQRARLSQLASVGVHPGSTPGRRARTRCRKSSTPATAQHTAAYCDGSGAPNLSVSLSKCILTCGASVRVSQHQATGSLPVVLMSILAPLHPPRTNLCILESLREKCRETLAVDP